MDRPLCVIGQNALPDDHEQSSKDIKGLDLPREESDRLLGTDYVVGTMCRKSWSLPPLHVNW